jgi:hypothetical protein
VKTRFALALLVSLVGSAAARAQAPAFWNRPGEHVARQSPLEALRALLAATATYDESFNFQPGLNLYQTPRSSPTSTARAATSSAAPSPSRTCSTS